MVLLTACGADDIGYGNLSYLEIASVGTSDSSRAAIDGVSLPDEEAEKGLGLFLKSADGTDYDGISSGYSNVLYSLGASGWASEKPIRLSGTRGMLYAYFPYNPDADGIEHIPVTSSLNGTDYMYAEALGNVNASNRNVDIVLRHALSRITVSFFIESTYSGNGILSGFSMESDGIAPSGFMNAATGDITAECGKVSFETGMSILEGTVVEDCLLVPVGKTCDREMRLNCMIDGKEYSLTLSGDNCVTIGQGIRSEIAVSVSNEEIRVLDVWAGKWEDGGEADVRIDGKRTVKIELQEKGMEKDIIYRAYPDQTMLTVKAFSKSGRSIVCSVPAACAPSYDKTTGVYSFIISDFIGNVTAVLGYPDDDSVLEKVRADAVDKVSYAYDIFIDGGIGLDCGAQVNGYVYKVPLVIQDLFPADRIHRFLTVDSKKVKADTTKQMNLFNGDDLDKNGTLLYPDGSPRYRILFIQGGTGNGGLEHAELLSAEAKENIRTFFNNGGSIVTSGAAGSLLAGSQFDGEAVGSLLKLQPWNTVSNKSSVSQTGIVPESGSALSSYESFASSSFNISNPSGVYLDSSTMPEGTEILARYKSGTTYDFNSAPSVWSARRSAGSGRLVACGGKPDQSSSATSDAYRLFKSELEYAMDGNGYARVKGVLHNGESRYMDIYEGDPSHSPIGDRQCHYFVFELDKDVSRLELSLSWSNPVSMELYLKHDDFAFPGSSDCVEIKSSDLELPNGAPLVLELNDVPKGLWYATVRCATSPAYSTTALSSGYGTSSELSSGSAKDGSRETLKGIPYTVTAFWAY